MRCEKCGKKLKSGEIFCSSCGYYNSKADSDSEDWKNNEEETDDDLLIFEESTEPKPVEDENEQKKDDESIDYLFEDRLKQKEKLIEVKQDVKEFNLKANSSGTKENEFYYENEDLLEKFIGEDYKLIKKSPFNIYAFLLNWMYVLYRKMYIFGVIGLIVTGVIFLFFKKYLLIYAIVTIILLGLIFNKIYIFLGKLKVERYIRKNPKMDHFDLEKLMEKKGGVNIPKALIIYGIFLIVIILNLFTITFNKKPSKFFNENSQNQATCISILKSAYREYKKDEYLGTIQEGVCKKTNKTDYDVYIKTIKDKKEQYIYYYASNGTYTKKLTTEKYEELLIKHTNNNITEEEKQQFEDIKNILSEYEYIKVNAKEEDEKVKNNTDKKEKQNFMITKEEITR